MDETPIGRIYHDFGPLLGRDPVLRDKIISSIRESLERSKFSVEEFTFDQTEKEGTTTLTISYRFDSRFFFRLSVKANAGSDFSYMAAPGSVAQRESGTVSTYHLSGTIQEWANRVLEDLVAPPVMRQISEQSKAISEMLSQFDTLEDEYFTKEEAAEMRRKLDELETNLLAQLESADANQKELRRKADQLHKEIETLKGTVESLKKPGFAGSVMVRLSSFFNDPENAKLLKTTTAEIGKQLLIEAGKKSLSP
ncbi:MAG: hypothetical protein ACJ8AK_07110 [Gemmatimonadaceae bacterium]